MQSREFGVGRVLFLYMYDHAAQKSLHRFGNATELIALFHSETGMTPIMRPEQHTLKRWRCYIQHKVGSLVSTDIVVSADDEAQALACYFDVCLQQLLNERGKAPDEKSFSLCEGEKGLLWLLDQDTLFWLFRHHNPLLPDSFFTDQALLDWMAYSSLSKPEYMTLLSELADKYPELISPAQRVQIGLQIIERDRALLSGAQSD